METLNRSITVAGYGHTEVEVDGTDCVAVLVNVGDVTGDPSETVYDTTEATQLRNALNEALDLIERRNGATPEPKFITIDGAVREVNPLTPKESDDPEGAVEAFIEAELAAMIKYEKEGGEIVYRHISPYEVRTSQYRRGIPAHRFVVAFDHERQAIRNFRIDAIHGICPSLASYVPEDAA